MPCVYIKPLYLLIAVLGLNFISINALDDCRTMFLGYYNSACNAQGRQTCPTTCKEYLTNFHKTCEGKEWSESFSSPYSVADFLIMSPGRAGPCDETIKEEFLLRFEAPTCDTVLAANLQSSYPECSEEGECSVLCRNVIGKMYSTCDALYITTIEFDEEEWGGIESDITVQELSAYLINFRSDSCNAYAAGKSWPSGNASTDPSSGPSALPSMIPSSLPSVIPSSKPSSVPSTTPSLGPSASRTTSKKNKKGKKDKTRTAK